MKIGQQIRFIVINKQASSLYSLIADGQYRATSLGRDTWKTLIGSQASLQPNCNKEEFNVECFYSYRSKARIGLLGNNENDCESADSRIGFGTGGTPDDTNSCGNQQIRTMGYILIQWKKKKTDKKAQIDYFTQWGRLHHVPSFFIKLYQIIVKWRRQLIFQLYFQKSNQSVISISNLIPYLRWLKTVSSTYIWMSRYNHSLSLDATIMVSKNSPIIGEHIVIIFLTQ